MQQTIVLLIAVALCATSGAFAQSSTPRIAISHTSLTIDEGFQQVITFTLDEPIICPQDTTHECAVVVTVENPRPDQISLDNCVIRWNWDDWHQVRTLRVAAVEDFIDDAGFMAVLVTEPAISRSEYYSGFDAANITVRTRPRSSAQCSGTGDPHYHTFDRKYWHVYFAGRYVLYKSTAREFEVQVQTRAYPARHCAFAAREGNDVVVVWACNGAPVSRRSCYSSECRRGGYPRLSISGSSRHAQYVVEFASGAMVRADTYPYYMGMYVTAPGIDQGNTAGICGNFNGNPNDDAKTYVARSYSDLFSSQIPSYDLFAWNPPSGPETTAPTTILNNCDYVEPTFIRPILNRPDAEDITDFIRDASLDEIIEDETIVIGGGTVDENGEGISLEQATLECAEVLANSNVAAVCTANIPDFTVDEFVDGCAEDLQETGDLDFIEDALEDMERVCAERASRDQNTWETMDGTPVEPSVEIQEGICLHECNNNGDCVEGLCRCFEGFLGSDCSINTNAEPVIQRLVEPFCDSAGVFSCTRRLTVTGSNFWNSDNLACRFDSQVVDAFYLGSMEIACAVPNLIHRGGQEVTRQVAVTLDGETFVTADEVFTYYDGTCQICDIMTGECGRNPESCTIDGQCYLDGFADPTNICRECNPESSISEWSWTYENHVECGPSFASSTYTATIVGSAEVDEVIFVVDASNDNVADDTNNVIRYSLTGGEEHFVINSNGEVVTVVRLDAVDVPSSFDNLLRITATDSAGNEATTAIVLDILVENIDPLFNSTYEFSVPEDTPVGTVIATVQASDANGDELSYGWFSTEEGYGDVFAIDEVTGEVSLNRTLDYEDKSFFQLVLRARDQGGQYHVTTFEVTVLNVDEAPDSIALEPSTIAENSPAGTVVGELTAHDPDGEDTFTFSTTSSDFTVDGNQLITVTENFDFESDTTTYTIPITVTDSTDLSFTQEVTVTVTDVNEKPTNIQLEIYNSESYAIREGVDLVDSFVGRVTAEDPDGDRVTCQLVDNAGHFQMVQNELSLVAALDFEEAESVTISVRCVDNGSPEQVSDLVEFTIDVINTDDGPENFRLVDATPIAEDAQVGDVVGVIVATDRDGGAEFEFTLSDESVFTLGDRVPCTTEGNALTCGVELVLSTPIDFETDPVVTISISATSNGAYGEGLVDIPIRDVNEPVTGVAWFAGANTIPENAQEGDVVGRLIILEEDSVSDVVYDITLLNHQDVFAINSLQGSRRRSTETVAAEVVVVDPSSFDYETEAGSEFTISLSISDGETTATVSTTILVTDAPLVLVTDPSFIEIPEDIAVGTVVATLNLEGADHPDASYALSLVTDGNGAFALDGNDVVIARMLNFEDNQNYVIRVSIETDTTPEELSFSITVIDVDEAPIITIDNTNVNVINDENIGRIIARVTVNDEDSTILETYIDFPEESALSTVFRLRADGSIVLIDTPQAAGLDLGSYTLPIIAVTDTHMVQRDIAVNIVDRCFSNECEDAETCVVSVGSYDCCARGSCVNSNSVDFDNRFDVTSTASETTTDDSITIDPVDLSASTNNNASTTVIIPAVIGAIVLIALIVVLVVLVRRRRNDPNTIFGSTDKTYSSNPTFRNPNETVYSEVNTNASSFTPGVCNPLYEWYQPNMERPECTQQLADKPVGSFIVRDSKACPGWHMLGVRTETSVVHEKIRLASNGSYELLASTTAKQPTFQSVPELVDFYKAPRDDIDFVLTNAVSNPMYDMAVRDAAIPTDQAAPMVPLKSAQKATVAHIAAVNEGEFYTNTDEAMHALNSNA